MKFTNNFNIPESIVNVLTKGSHAPVGNRFSATDIVSPPWMRVLRERNWDRMQQDVSDMMWMLLGLAPHYIIQGGAPPEGLAEEKMTYDLDGFTIVCIPDLWHNREITDWKITSVYSFLLGDKPEWEKQLNIYKWMYGKHGFETDRLTIHAILRDWQKSKTLTDSKYPPIPFNSIDIPVWNDDYTEGIIRDWIVGLDMPVPCSDQERWARPTTWAVMKKGNKKALRVLDTESNAKQWLVNNTYTKDFYVQKREGEYIRCKSFCNVAPFCSANPYRETT